MTELELMANEEARHGNREALERLEREAELQAQEIDKTRRRADKWQSMVLDCEEYLKPGETPRQRMDRDHADVLALIKLLEASRRKSEWLEAENKLLNEQMAVIEEMGTESLNALPDCLMRLAPALVENDELKAKLAKAVEALELQAEALSNALELDIITERHRTEAFLLLKKARATLAELTGGKE